MLGFWDLSARAHFLEVQVLINKIDARGLLCPEPVLLVKKMLEEQSGGVIEVLVDNNVAMENITRFAENREWEVGIIKDENENEILIRLSK